jgi:hypothetical protein
MTRGNPWDNFGVKRRLACLLVIACGCPHGNGTRPYAEPNVADLVARLGKQRDELTAFRADATMDYWLAGQRAKGEVLVMGTTGARVRFAALSPAGGQPLAEMACDGANFVYVDYQNNCTLSGPCTKESIARFFHIELEPDDFVHLALGAPPVVGGIGTVTWDAKCGCEKLELHGGGATERLTIDMREHRFDVLDAELVGADGKTEWRVDNKDFVEVDKHRVPGKSRFKSPAQQKDLLVDWGKVGDRAVNMQTKPDQFQLSAPNGVPMCGGGGSGGSPPPKP